MTGSSSPSPSLYSSWTRKGLSSTKAGIWGRLESVPRKMKMVEPVGVVVGVRLILKRRRTQSCPGPPGFEAARTRRGDKTKAVGFAALWAVGVIVGLELRGFDGGGGFE